MSESIFRLSLRCPRCGVTTIESCTAQHPPPRQNCSWCLAEHAVISELEISSVEVGDRLRRYRRHEQSIIERSKPK